jgi:homoprotocatechuate degradation regulator HpaR
MALLQAREAVMNRFRPMLRAHGVTEQQWRVLRALSDGESPEAGELARRCCLLTPSLTRIIRTLNQQGLLIRQIDTRDLRRVRLSISDKGRRLIADVAPHSEAHYAAITAHFGEDNLQDLYDKLAALVEALDGTDQAERGG